MADTAQKKTYRQAVHWAEWVIAEIELSTKLRDHKLAQWDISSFVQAMNKIK